MLFFACAWAILLTVCYLAGLGVLHLFTDLTPFDRIGDRLVLALWSGVAIISWVLLALALGTPLLPIVGAAVALLAILCAILSPAIRAEIAKLKSLWSPSVLLGFLVLPLGVAAYAAQPVSYYDTGLYHFGAIRWLARYGAVLGLSLIHLRFGSASAWFALLAPFNAGPAEARIGALGGGFALLLALLHLILCVWRLVAGRARSADWVAIVAYAVCLPFFIYWELSRSASPDAPVILLGILVAWAITITIGAEQLEHASQDFSSRARLIPFLLAAGAVNMKLSAVPLLVVTGFFYALRGKAFVRRMLVIGVLILVLLLPLFAHGIITTGCPLFPAPFLCADFPWSVGADKATADSIAVREWARWNGPGPLDANNWNWIASWLILGVTRKSTAFMIASALLIAAGVLLRRRFKQPGFGIAIVGLGALGLVGFLVLRAQNLFMVSVSGIATVSWLIYRRSWTARRNWLLAVGLPGIALTFYAAPALKFGLSYSAVLGAQFMLSRTERVRRFRSDVTQAMSSLKFGHTNAALSLMLLIVGLMFSARPIAARLGTDAVRKANAEGFGLPPALPGADVAHKRVNDLDYFMPTQGDQCWAAELPCANGELDGDIRLRDPARGISAGFARK